MRIFLKKIKGKTYQITIKENQSDITINTKDICFAKSASNYLDIFTENRKYVVRETISDFHKRLPDRLEYVRIHRSYLVRIDKVTAKSSKLVEVNNGVIPVGKTYTSGLDFIII